MTNQTRPLKTKPLLSSFFINLFVLLSSFLLLSCTASYNQPLGSEKNPIKIFFIPSADVGLMKSSGKELVESLEKLTPYKYKFSVPTSYVAVIEALGSKRADFAFFSTFPYLVASDKYGVKALLIIGRHGHFTYRSQILARADSDIKSLKDLKGKKVAFVDPSSTSGFILPQYEFKRKNIKPSETVFAQRHDNVITMLYQKQVDAGATFYSPPEKGKIQDARRLVLTQYPNIEEEVKIIHLTQEIPNEPFVGRKGIDPEIEKAVTEALLKLIKTKEGKHIFNQIGLITGLKKTTDQNYKSIRDVLKVGKVSAENLMKKK